MLALFSLPLWSVIKLGMDVSYFVIPTILLLVIDLIINFKKVQILILFVLYSFLYFLYLIPYFWFHIRLSAYTEFQNFQLFSFVLFEFYLFYLGLSLSSIKCFNPQNIRLKNCIHFYCPFKIQLAYLLFLFIVLGVIMKQGQNVFLSSSPYNAYMDNLESSSALPMFWLLFMFFGHYVIRQKQMRIISFPVLYVLFMYFCITRGYRNLLAPVIFLMFLFYFDSKIKLKWLLWLFLFAFVAMIGLNALKMGVDFKWIYLLTESDEFILSHHADNLYISAQGLGLVGDDRISFWNRIMLNIGFLLESIYPPSLLPDFMKYPAIIRLHADNGGGGLCIGGAFLMWGFGGILLFGYLLGELIRVSYNYSNKSLKLISMVVLIFSANWFSYDFHVILRFSVFACIIYILFKAFGYDKEKYFSC